MGWWAGGLSCPGAHMAGTPSPTTAASLLQMPMLPGGAGADGARHEGRQVRPYLSYAARGHEGGVTVQGLGQDGARPGLLAWERGLTGSQASGRRPNLASPHVALALVLALVLALAGAGVGAGVSCTRCSSPVPPAAHPLGLEISGQGKVVGGMDILNKVQTHTGKQARG